MTFLEASYSTKGAVAALIVITVGTVMATFSELTDRVPYLWNEVSHRGSYGAAIAFTLVWLLVITATMAMVAVAPLWVRVLYAIGFFGSSVLMIAYQRAMHEPMGVTEFERTLEAAGFVLSAAVQFLGSIALAITLSLPLTVGLIVSQRWFRSRLKVRPAVMIVCILAPLLASVPVTALIWVRGGEKTSGMPSNIRPLAYRVAIFVDGYTSRGLLARSSVRSIPTSTESIKNIVLVVDESVVADVFDPSSKASIARNIGQLASVEYDFGPASSGSNCSADSNLILRFGPRPTDIQHDIAVSPSIWEYAQKAGYTTTYIDMQESTDNLHNWMTAEERKHIDKVILDGDAPVYLRDRFAGKALLKLLSNQDKNFIYINKIGAHFPWDSKYPPSAAVYVPTLGISGSAYLAHAGGQADLLTSMADFAGSERSKNSYRNAVEWNYNTFFEALRDPRLLEDTVLIYTSDHGQNIYRERGNVATHCSSAANAALSEGRTPLSVFTAVPKWAAVLKNAAEENQGRVSHFNIFASLLEMLGYGSPTQEIPRAPTLWAKDPSPHGLIMATDIMARFGRTPALVTICKRRTRLTNSGSCTAAYAADRADISTTAPF